MYNPIIGLRPWLNVRIKVNHKILNFLYNLYKNVNLQMSYMPTLYIFAEWILIKMS